MPAMPSISPSREELARPLLPQALDVHRAAAHELLDRLEQLARAARAVGADRPDAVLGLAPSGVPQAGHLLGRLGQRRAVLALLRLRGRRHHARDHVARAGDDHLVALAHVLARDVLLVVQRGELHRHARDLHRLELGERHHVAGPAHVPHHPLELGGGGHRRELPGDRPARLAAHHAEPALQVQVVDLDHHAVDLEVERLAPLLPARQAATTASRSSWRSMSGLTLKPCSRSHSSDSSGSRTRSPPARRSSSPTSTAAARRPAPESSWRIEPAAELRGLAKVGSPAAARCSLSSANARAAGRPRRAPPAAAARPPPAAASP